MKTKETIEHITDWLKQYAHQSNSNGFVIGVSGGIDSAVASTLAARTELPLLVVEMPIYQSASQVTRARNHISFLKRHYPKVDSHTVDLTLVFDQLINALPPAKADPAREMSLVNTRARLRMTTLYYFAALHRYLVVGTGNKIEDFGVGFFTKYGDGGVDLSPIADLVKTEVYALGKTLGIIESIMTAPPTDGLWGDDRTDEDQIGASYPELEWAMSFQGDETSLDSRQKTVLKIYRDYHQANRHKMEPIPICTIPSHLRQEKD
jgi:NAD+ synthase